MGKEEILLCLVLATNAFRNLFCEKIRRIKLKCLNRLFFMQNHMTRGRLGR
jgi:hypothetical protein